MPVLALFADHPHPLFRALIFLTFVGLLAALIATRIIARHRRQQLLDQRLKSLEDKIDRLAGTPK